MLINKGIFANRDRKKRPHAGKLWLMKQKYAAKETS
jgi:hypothetical protein